MRRYLSCVVVLAISAITLAAQPAARGVRPVDPTAITEQTGGWRMLFDGKTTSGWHGFKKAGFPTAGWSIENGRLKHAATGGSPTKDSGDIITIETFNDFDLRFEWMVAP